MPGRIPDRLEDLNGVTATTPQLNALAGGNSAIVVSSAGSNADRGAALLAAYTAAKSLTPNGATISSTNPAFVLLTAGAVYDITSLEGADAAATIAAYVAHFDNINVRIVGPDGSCSPLIITSYKTPTVVPYPVASICSGVRMAAALSTGGYRQPLKLPGFSAQNFAYRGVTPKRGNGLTTRLHLTGQNFATWGSTAADDANAAKLLPVGTKIFSENGGDTYTEARCTGANLPGTTVDITTALIQVDFIVHPTHNMTQLKLLCINADAKQVSWVIWKPLTGLSPAGSGRFRVSVSMASAISGSTMTAGFDPSAVTIIGLQALLAGTHSSPVFSICGVKFVNPPADGKARLLLTIDDNHQSIVPALHAAADAGVFATLFPICRLLDDPAAVVVTGGYHGWGDLAALRDRGHRIGNHSFDHHTTYWQENGDRMMYDIQAAQERLAEMGFSDSLRMVAGPGGGWPVDRDLPLSVCDYFRTYNFPTESGSGVPNTILDAPIGFGSATYLGELQTVENQLDMVTGADDAGPVHAGAMVSVVLHGLDEGSTNTRVKFDQFLAKVVGLVNDNKLVVVHPHDLLGA